MTNILINKDDHQNDFLAIFSELGERPSRILIQESIPKDKIDSILSLFERVNSASDFYPLENEISINERCLLKRNNMWVSYLNIDKESENSTISDICIFFLEREIESAKKIAKKICKSNQRLDDKSVTMVGSISILNGSFEVDPISIPTDPIYKNEDIDKLTSSINKNKNGIHLIKGELGMGKSTSILYSLGDVESDCLFIPNNMIDQTINNPEFRNFIKKFSKLTLIIDDFESAYLNYPKPSYIINNIIQILNPFSNVCNVHFILISNDSSFTEYNLINSGYVITDIEFKKISRKEALKISKKIGRSIDSNKKEYKMSEIVGNKIHTRKIGIE